MHKSYPKKQLFVIFGASGKLNFGTDVHLLWKFKWLSSEANLHIILWVRYGYVYFYAYQQCGEKQSSIVTIIALTFLIGWDYTYHRHSLQS